MNVAEREISQIYDVLIASIVKTPLRSFLYVGKVQGLLLASMVLCSVSMVVSASLLSNKLVALVLLGLTVLISFVYAGIALAPMIKSLFNPSRHFLADLRQQHVEELDLLRRFSPFSTRSLKSVAERLRARATNLRIRAALLIGSLDKLGIVPALVAFGFLFAEYQQEPTLGQFGYYLAAAFVSVHVVALLVSSTIERAENLARLLDQAVAQFEDAEASAPSFGALLEKRA